MKKKLFLIGMCIVVCMAAGCKTKTEESKEKENSTKTVKTESTKQAEKETQKEEQETTIDEEIMKELAFEKKTFPGVKDRRNLPKDTSNCPLHIENVKWEGDYLYITDCQGGLYAFQWKKEKLESLLQDEEYKNSYQMMRDMNGGLYVTDIQDNHIKVYCLQEGKKKEIAKIDNQYTVITMDKDYLYVKMNKEDEIKQIKISTPDKMEDETNPIIKNLSEFFKKYHTEDYNIQRWEYEKDNWYVYLVNWKKDKDEIYKIDKSGKTDVVMSEPHIAWAGVRQGKVYVFASDEDDSKDSENTDGIDGSSSEKLYSIDEKGNRELYFNLSKVKQLEENGFDVYNGECGKNELVLLEQGPRSAIMIYDEKENKITYFSEWEKQE